MDFGAKTYFSCASHFSYHIITYLHMSADKFKKKLNCHQIADGFQDCILANLLRLFWPPHGLFTCM